LAQQPPVAQSLLIHNVSRSHTTTHHSRQDSSGRVIISSQRPLPDNTTLTTNKQTNTHVSGGIQTHNLSRRAAEDLRLRPRGHWDRPLQQIPSLYISSNKYILKLDPLLWMSLYTVRAEYWTLEC